MTQKRPFNLPAGTLLGSNRYRVERLLGRGWEGEVYKVVEQVARAARTAKLFYPERNERNRTVRRYARQLERLRGSGLVMQYHHSESVELDGGQVTMMVGDYFEGRTLAELPRDRRGRQLQVFEALHVLYGLVCGLESIHAAGLYHGDLHAANVLVRRVGVRFELCVVDFFHRGPTRRAQQHTDIIDAVRLLYDLLDGARHYATFPAPVKAICRGLRHDLILERFPSARRLRTHLERFPWE
jgi:serine/threonine protein kinase